MTVKDEFSGKTALITLKDSFDEYDVIFIDIVLQDMNGVVIYDKLRELSYTKKIVMMTSAPDSDEVKEAKLRGLFIYDKEDLSTILSDLFGDPSHG